MKCFTIAQLTNPATVAPYITRSSANIMELGGVRVYVTTDLHFSNDAKTRKGTRLLRATALLSTMPAFGQFSLSEPEEGDVNAIIMIPEAVHNLKCQPKSAVTVLAHGTEKSLFELKPEGKLIVSTAKSNRGPSYTVVFDGENLTVNPN